MNRIRPAIPRHAVRRMTRYLTYLQGLREAGEEWVSSRDIADALGLTSSTVRQDLSHVDFYGVSKRGYEIAKLQEALSSVLGADREWRMVVVGAGNLGRALALHEEFQRRGFQICSVFDTDPKKIGRKVGNLTIRAMRELPAFVGREKVNIGIIAVPAAAAQSVADLLIASGVRGLLNLALTHILAPAYVPVVDSRIITNVMELSHAIQMVSRQG